MNDEPADSDSDASESDCDRDATASDRDRDASESDCDRDATASDRDRDASESDAVADSSRTDSSASDSSPPSSPTTAESDSSRADLEILLARQYVARLEAIDAETERLLESLAETEPFDERTRALARRHLREVRAQLHPVMLALRYRVIADESGDSS
ncbi:hypothetical protein [Natronolimnohabitans innermongolicus]|uniref:Uncharacterized protein n=1 Tax=Natronolimnohabitans innermongolicus JCM 12255 TaxID=1227499 RepID=L9WHX4_9EURY|nr:hypothetical protein [Natronolimnohabitans innermongolicus]ELY48967.1 hypothetical protein C493_21261 [Natronolimnohabitans innermongolicus JCM 12255]